MILATLQQLKDWLSNKQHKRDNRKLYMEARRVVRQRGHGFDPVRAEKILADMDMTEKQLRRGGGVAHVQHRDRARHHRKGTEYFLLRDGTKVLKDFQGNIITTIPPGS